VSSAFFSDLRWAQLALGLLCYLGLCLNAAGLSVWGVRREPAQALVTLLFLGLFPLPLRWSSPALELAQYAAVALAIAGIGANQVRFALMRHRALRAYTAGTRPSPLGFRATVLIVAPVLVLAGSTILETGRDLLAAGFEPRVAGLDASGAEALIGRAAWRILWVVTAFAAYMGVAGLLDRQWMRIVGRIRLLNTYTRYVWINSLVALASVVTVAVIATEGVTSAAGRGSFLAIVVFSLVPGLNQLPWVYDAIGRRVLAFHVLLAVAAATVFGTRTLFDWLGAAPAVGWTAALAAVAIAAAALPARVDDALERWFFPRAGKMRARLLAIAAEPLVGATRAEAARHLLGRVVAVLDGEGGLVVLPPTAAEPALLEALGRVDPGPLGATPASVARVVGELGLGSAPHPIEALPLAQQLRLLSCGVMLACPLAGRRTEGTLLLGPRPGWLYDVATVQALGVFASHAGLALENLALAAERVHAEKLAALGEAAARIAHEIRNPLAAARSYVQQLRASDGADGLIEPAVDELDRIGRLVTDLLAFARRDELQARGDVDLAAVCRQAVEQTASLAAARAVQIETELAPATVSADLDRLVQVIANLCRNAVEALGTREPPRRLRVRCAPEQGAGVVEVRDNGPGIPADELPRVFEPFRTTKSSGTGLGLPIARRIVDAHGGRVAVESEPGTNTVFRVELPLVR